jgi:hypothetical protein
MKGLAGIAVAAFIAGAIALWFGTGPAVVIMKDEPLKPDPALPTFHRVTVPETAR